MGKVLLRAISSALSKIAMQKISLLLGSIGMSALTGILYYELRLTKYLPTPPDLWTVRLIALEIITIFSFTSLFYWFKPKFKHLPTIGVQQNLKTGAYFCHSCLIKDNLHSPLKTEVNGWRCLIKGCRCFYYNPEYIEPPITVPKRERY